MLYLSLNLALKHIQLLIILQEMHQSTSNQNQKFF